MTVSTILKILNKRCAVIPIAANMFFNSIGGHINFSILVIIMSGIADLCSLICQQWLLPNLDWPIKLYKINK